MKICPNCGIQCEDHMKFCSECGFSFANAPELQPYDQQSTSQGGMEALEFLEEEEFQPQAAATPQPQVITHPQPQAVATPQPQAVAIPQPQVMAEPQPQAGGTLYTFPGPEGVTGGKGWQILSEPADMLAQGEPEIRTYYAPGTQSYNSAPAAPAQQPMNQPVAGPYNNAPAAHTQPQQAYSEPAAQQYNSAPASPAQQTYGGQGGDAYYGNAGQQLPQGKPKSGRRKKSRKNTAGAKRASRQKGRGSKLPLIIGAVALLAIVIALAVIFVPRLLGGKSSTDFVGAQVDFLEDRAALFTDSLTKETLSSDITIRAEVDGRGETADLLNDVLDGTSVVAKLDSSKKTLLLNAALNLKGSNVLEGFFRMTPDEIGFSVPTVDDTYYIADLADLADTLGFEMGKTQNISSKEIRDDIDAIVDRYRKVLTKHISKDKLKTEKNRDVKLSEAGKTVKCTVMTWEPEEDDLIDLFDAIADSLEDDEHLADLLDSLGLVNSGYDDALDMLADYADELRDNAENIAEDIVDTGLVWTLALDKKGQVALVMIEDDNIEIVLERAVDGKNGAEAFYMLERGRETIMVHNDYRISGSKCTGEITVDMGYSSGALEYDIDFSKKSVFGLPYGTYATDLRELVPGLSLELNVTGGKSGSTDHVLSIGGLKDLTGGELQSVDLIVNTTTKSSAKEPSGKKEDISDYDERELSDLFSELGYGIVEELIESPELEDLTGLLYGY